MTISPMSASSELIGPFAAGSTIVMTPIGDEPIELRITEAVEPEFFVADMFKKSRQRIRA